MKKKLQLKAKKVSYYKQKRSWYERLEAVLQIREARTVPGGVSFRDFGACQ